MRRGLIVLSLALAAGGALAFPLAAFAHALAQSSDPATGEVLQNTPQFVTITFSETPDLRLSSIRILDTSGREYDQGAAQAPPGNPKQLRVAMKPAGKGVYTVSWRTVSAVDGHLATGSFAFGVGVSAASLRTGPSTVSGSPGPTPLAVAGRWFLYAGVALMLGAALVSLLAFSRLPPRSPQLLALGVMLAVLGTLAISESQRSDAAIAYGQILDTSLGRNLLARAAPMVAALVGLFLAWRGGTARRRWGPRAS